jgi:hypothetical protein
MRKLSVAFLHRKLDCSSCKWIIWTLWLSGSLKKENCFFKLVLINKIMKRHKKNMEDKLNLEM